MADCMKDKPVLEKQDSVQWFILETIKALGLRPHAFICFSVSGYRGQALALVFDLLLHSVFRHQKVNQSQCALVRAQKKFTSEGNCLWHH